jgi:predicted transcriptional regulator
MAVREAKKRGFQVPISKPFKVTNMDRETVSSLGSKLREAISEIQDLKERVRELEEKVQELEPE